MHGNVWEFCQSAYRAYPYNAADGREDITKPQERVLRGGAWCFGPWYMRSPNRRHRPQDRKWDMYGFRVAATKRGNGR